MVRGVFRKVKRGIDMKDIKKTTILCLATFLAFGLCSCSSDTEVTTAPSTTAEETTETTTTATEETTEETTATDRQTVRVDLGSVMGFDDCYAEGEV
jgi:PBP1b-binding outer membrane lipoprotein LpoB